MLYDQTGSRILKMAASKPERPISQHVDMSTISKAIAMFLGSVIQ